MKFPTVSPTDVAAWWGAVVATAVLAWDAYKWRKRGAQIQINATPKMRVLNVPGISQDDRFVSVTVFNTGDQPSTITNLCGFHFESIWHQIVRCGTGFVVVNPGFGPGVPAVIQPGGQWQGGISQSELEEDPGPGGRLYCGVATSTTRKPVYARVRLPKTASDVG